MWRLGGGAKFLKHQQVESRIDGIPGGLLKGNSKTIVSKSPIPGVVGPLPNGH